MRDRDLQEISWDGHVVVVAVKNSFIDVKVAGIGSCGGLPRTRSMPGMEEMSILVNRKDMAVEVRDQRALSAPVEGLTPQPPYQVHGKKATRQISLALLGSPFQFVNQADVDSRDDQDAVEQKLLEAERTIPEAVRFLEVTALRYCDGRSTLNLGGSKRNAWDLARKDQKGSRLIQKAIEVLAARLQQGDSEHGDAYQRASTTAWGLISELEGHVLEGLNHQHANHVFKVFTEFMPTDYVAWIAAELQEQAYDQARHRFGCRTCLRLVHHCGKDSNESKKCGEVMDEILTSAGQLCRDPFGQYVIMEVIEKGSAAQRNTVAAAIRHQVIGPHRKSSHDRHGKGKQGSRIIEKVLTGDEANSLQFVATCLFASVDTVRRLIQTEFGCKVMRALALSSAHSQVALDYMSQLDVELKSSKQGRQLLDEINQASHHCV